MVSGEQFLEYLRSALKHLYDPYYLRRSPLIGLFGLQDQPDAIPALQRILTEAIEALEPKPGVSSPAQNQLTYDLLFYRYVQQFSQEEVANQLGMSVRHMRREQNAATYVLAGELWRAYNLSDRAFDAPLGSNEGERSDADESANHDELAFLREGENTQPLDVPATLNSALDLARPLAGRYGLELELDLAGELPEIIAQPVALRQLLINLLTIAINRAQGESVQICADVRQGMVTIEILCRPGRTSALPETPVEKSNLEMAYRLAEICGSKLEFHVEGDTFRATFNLLTKPQVNVLVIDDNLDNIALMQHFVAGTRYHLTGTNDTNGVFKHIEQQSPQLIVLDVMMPHVDGWEILGRLRSHPQSSHIPVIVCTILAQEELALSLGASGFIHKPITRQNLLAELDHQSALLEKGSR